MIMPRNTPPTDLAMLAPQRPSSEAGYAVVLPIESVLLHQLLDEHSSLCGALWTRCVAG